MILERDCNIEIDIVLKIDYYTPGTPERDDDPGTGPEIEFIAYIKNAKGDLIMLQDEIFERYADDLYELAIDMISNEKQARKMETAEHKYESEKEAVLRRR